LLILIKHPASPIDQENCISLIIRQFSWCDRIFHSVS